MHNISALILLVLSFGIYPCQAGGIYGEADGQSGLVFKNKNHSFDEAESYQIIHHVFDFKNFEEYPIRITKIESSCGCTRVQATSNLVESNGVAEVKVIINLQGRSGPIHEKIVIKTDNKQQPFIPLSIGGVVRSNVSIEPHIVTFDNVPKNENRSSKVKLKMPLGFEVLQGEVKCEGDFFEARIVSHDSAGDNRYGLVVNLKPQHKLGVRRGHLVLPVKGSVPDVKIPVNAYIVSNVVANPSEIILLGSRSPEHTVTRVLRIKSAINGLGFDIKNVEMPDASINYKVVYQSEDNSDYLIKFENIPSNNSLQDTEILIRIDGGEIDPIRVPISVKN